jgi:parallel beta-helix repeat protein
VVTSDFIEANNEVRYGRTYLDSVEIYNCSQYDTYKAALRFQGNAGSWSSVQYSVLHHGLGMGVDIEDAENVLFSNNDMFDFVRFGINIMTSNNITIDNNWVHGIFSRHLKA